jgi:SulP family sulfate permease
VIAILETLISAKIADGMTKTKFKRRREMLGLGLANIASGVAGGLPATAALARTSLNVKSGANSSMSAGFNTVCVAIISLILLPVFKFLPLAIVASILVYIACRMIQTEHFLRLLRHDRLAFGLSLFVAALTIVIDPMIGILVGATVSLLLFVNTLAKGHSEVTINENGRVTARKTAHTFHQLEHQGDTLVYRFAGPLTYINAAPHLEIMQKIHKPHTVIFAFRNLFFLDLDGVDALEEMVEILERKHIRVAFTGMSELIAPVLVKTGLYKRKQREDLVFSSTSEAVKALS